ncbi:MAG: hypothetical protein R3277_06115 [Brumimicrobium sp.]|nr:hypothetical protein [Brumimicrobium sp.]
MRKLLFVLLISSVTFGSNVFGQVNYSDDKIEVTSQIKKFEDKVNDIFYSYYQFKIENKSNETIEVALDFIYHDGNSERNKSQGDANLVFTLAPNETIEGDINGLKALTLFKEFNTGNSGKKASEVTNELNEITVKYF